MPRKQTEQWVLNSHCRWDVLNVLNVPCLVAIFSNIDLVHFLSQSLLGFMQILLDKSYTMVAAFWNCISRSQLMVVHHFNDQHVATSFVLFASFWWLTVICNAGVWEAATKLHAWNKQKIYCFLHNRFAHQGFPCYPNLEQKNLMFHNPTAKLPSRKCSFPTSQRTPKVRHDHKSYKVRDTSWRKLT